MFYGTNNYLHVFTTLVIFSCHAHATQTYRHVYCKLLSWSQWTWTYELELTTFVFGCAETYDKTKLADPVKYPKLNKIFWVASSTKRQRLIFVLKRPQANRWWLEYDISERGNRGQNPLQYNLLIYFGCNCCYICKSDISMELCGHDKQVRFTHPNSLTLIL